MTRGRTGSRGHAGALRLLVLSWALGACASGTGGSAGPAEPTAAAGGDASAEPLTAVYTTEQATRGQRVFTTVCSVCHGRNEFTGPIFQLTWVAEPVGHLFQHISTTMPQDRPGSLTPQEYAAVVAYMLQLNGRPAGDRELPTDVVTLDRMRW